MIVYLAHGASGSAASMKPHVEGLERRGIPARTVVLPVARADRAVDEYARQVDEISSAVIGGHSFGGRVASLLAVETPPLGVVLLSYPLHRPGHPEETRTEHWPRIRCPVLLLSGEADPFAKVDLLESSVEMLPDAELVTYRGLRHGLTPVLEDVLDRIAGFCRRLSSAAD